MSYSEPGPSSRVDDDKDDNFKRTGSFRKILSGTASGSSQLNTSIKMIDRPTVTPNNSEFAIYLREYSILSEYKLMQKQNIGGVYVIPSAQNPYNWFGVLFVRQGMYKAAVFRFTIILPDTFPDSGCPKVVFQTKVFHPLIHNETGELNVAAGFPEWKKSNRVLELVQFITKVFNEVDPNMPAFNDEAANLFQNDKEEYFKRSQKCVREALDHVYDPPDTEDAHYIRFSKWDPEIHEPIKQQIYEETKTPKKLDDAPTGSSWVEPGTFKPLSKDPFAS
ncbi:protein crossbronx homolog [Chelonus insularis]|uniref:protein crossbronx homolog n=1 Tax=Chelonus insularis TaxID=460826 RepID=UPI00158F4384|nr:protein crossbronx homolog [Chelonus insularis]